MGRLLVITQQYNNEEIKTDSQRIKGKSAKDKERKGQGFKIIKRFKEMISIIIPVRFRTDLTRTCIDSILNYTNDFELILVQEGEDEEITELLKEYTEVHQKLREDLANIKKVPINRLMVGNADDIKFIQNKEPKGYAGALNAGMDIATGDYFCFMNNDTVATPGWMDEMLKGFDDKEVGLVAPTFWGTGERQSVDWNREGVDWDYVSEPFSIIGVCFLISRQCMEALKDDKYPGQWDEDFNHGGEDMDITLRVERAHYKMVIARKSFIYHYGGASTRIYIGSDLETVRKHHYARVLDLINKHNLDAEDTFARLTLK